MLQKRGGSHSHDLKKKINDGSARFIKGRKYSVE